jgi:hypothetical protein
MADCECLPGCLFFNNKMTDMPVTADRLKNHYCKGDNSDCARHMVVVAKGKTAVPVDLFPQNIERARAILTHG